MDMVNVRLQSQQCESMLDAALLDEFITVREVSGGVVARARATGRIRLVGVVLPKHEIKRRRMCVRAPWSMPINRVSQQEAYPL